MQSSVISVKGEEQVFMPSAVSVNGKEVELVPTLSGIRLLEAKKEGGLTAAQTLLDENTMPLSKTAMAFIKIHGLTLQ